MTSQTRGEKMRTARRSVALAALTLAAASALVACGDDKRTERLSVEDGPVGGANVINPAKLTAHEGNTVQIKITNTANDKPHGFSIDEFGIKETIDQGKTTTIEFEADKAGTFKVYCQLHPTHKPAELVIS
jgi:nitrosocyanin